MMWEAFLRSPWGGRSCLILLLIPLLLFGCTRELEEKLAGKEPSSPGLQTDLREVRDKLTILEASYAKQSEELAGVQRQRNDLTAEIKTLEATRATLEQSLTQSQAELAERLQSFDRLRHAQHTLTGQVGDRDTRIKEMTQQQAHMSERIRTLEQTRIEREQALTATQQELTQQQQAMSALQQEHQVLADRLQVRETEVRQIAQEKEGLQVQVAKLEGAAEPAAHRPDSPAPSP